MDKSTAIRHLEGLLKHCILRNKEDPVFGEWDKSASALMIAIRILTKIPEAPNLGN